MLMSSANRPTSKVEADNEARASDKGPQSYDCELMPMTTVKCGATPLFILLLFYLFRQSITPAFG
jgi:hypothetical protein